MLIEVKLTLEEIADRAQQLAELTGALIELDNAEETQRQLHNAEITKLKHQRTALNADKLLNKLQRTIRFGVEERDTQQSLFRTALKIAEIKENETTVKAERRDNKSAAANDDSFDDFTAEQCSECKHIDGAHTPRCTLRPDAIPFGFYVDYVMCHRIGRMSNPQSHARKLQLSGEKDAEVRGWLAAQEEENTEDERQREAAWKDVPQPKRTKSIDLKRAKQELAQEVTN